MIKEYTSIERRQQLQFITPLCDGERANNITRKGALKIGQTILNDAVKHLDAYKNLKLIQLMSHEDDDITFTVEFKGKYITHALIRCIEHSFNNAVMISVQAPRKNVLNLLFHISE